MTRLTAAEITDICGPGTAAAKIRALRRSCETCDLAEDVERLERERDALKEAAREVVRISDRKHEAWDRLKALLGEGAG